MNKFKYQLLSLLVLLCIETKAQVGINTLTPNSTLEINGSFSQKINQITATTTLQISHSVIICNPVSSIDVILPNASTCTGRIYIVKNITSQSVTIKPQSGQSVDGSSTFLLNTINATIHLISDGNNWFVLHKYLQ